jgi:hypothetical protein
MVCTVGEDVGFCELVVRLACPVIANRENPGLVAVKYTSPFSLFTKVVGSACHPVPTLCSRMISCGVKWFASSHDCGTLNEICAPVIVVYCAGVISIYSLTVPGGEETPLPGPVASVEVTIRPLIPVPVTVTLEIGVVPPTFTEMVLDGTSGGA